jgi:hypothetical protein
MCILKKYKNVLGVPREGVHKLRFLDTALNDYIGAILFAIMLTFFTKIPLVLSTIVSFIVGEILHYLFGVETNTLKYLNISCK